MSLGPGKYDDLCTQAREQAKAAPDPKSRCEKAFGEALDQGIPAEMIFAEIALGPKSTPPRNRREYLNQMLDRLLKQTGFAPSLAAGPTPAVDVPNAAGENAADGLPDERGNGLPQDRQAR